MEHTNAREQDGRYALLSCRTCRMAAWVGALTFPARAEVAPLPTDDSPDTMSNRVDPRAGRTAALQPGALCQPDEAPRPLAGTALSEDRMATSGCGLHACRNAVVSADPSGLPPHPDMRKEISIRPRRGLSMIARSKRAPVRRHALSPLRGGPLLRGFAQEPPRIRNAMPRTRRDCVARQSFRCSGHQTFTRHSAGPWSC